MIDAPEVLAGMARDRARPEGAPVVVGIAGAVSSGKSTLAEAVANRAATGGMLAEVVSTDGFLLSNAELTARGMLARKGFPDSYDVDALTAFVDEVHSGADVVTVRRYSHETYDVGPIERLRLVGDAVVIIEGVNALGALAGRLDLGVYLHAEAEDLERWYVTRFMSLCAEAADDPGSFYRQFVGMSEEEIEALAHQVWQGVNLVNLRDHIQPTRSLADCVVVKGPAHEITAIEMREHRSSD